MYYRRPIQDRAIQTEKRFLEAAKKLFAARGVASTSIDDIAHEAGLHRGAFLKRFGSKDGVKFLIYEEYCKEALSFMAGYRQVLQLAQLHDLVSALHFVSEQLETVQRKHFAASRAMYEEYAVGLEINRKTKEIFKVLVETIEATDIHFKPDIIRRPGSYQACAQLLVTLNFEYVLSAMPGLPKEARQRHRMISAAAHLALSQPEIPNEDRLLSPLNDHGVMTADKSMR